MWSLRKQRSVYEGSNRVKRVAKSDGNLLGWTIHFMLHFVVAMSVIYVQWCVCVYIVLCVCGGNN